MAANGPLIIGKHMRISTWYALLISSLSIFINNNNNNNNKFFLFCLEGREGKDLIAYITRQILYIASLSLSFSHENV
jgi:hypothetical protein